MKPVVSCSSSEVNDIYPGKMILFVDQLGQECYLTMIIAVMAELGFQKCHVKIVTCAKMNWSYFCKMSNSKPDQFSSEFLIKYMFLIQVNSGHCRVRKHG